MLPTPSLALRIVLATCFFAIYPWSVFESRLWSQSNDRAMPATNASDATLRACAAPSADRIWMVGDRGLILATDNGGRTWTEQDSDTTVDLEGVVFDNDKLGWAVGGSILSYSHRSVGTVLITQDGGQNWRSIGVPELPRLKGIRSFGGGHLIVWGDWSPTLQTGLIESHDGGSTWNPRELPASHLQSCAWYDAQRGVVIDRLSRVFYLSGTAPPELLSIGGDPTKPLLAAAINETGWWLAGECGQVYWSADGRNWMERPLPGNARDHRLISIHGLTLKDDHIWLVGVPGNVVWHSPNRGKEWEVQSLSTTLPMHCICVSKQDCLVAGGTLSNIQGTRNSGQGWWSIHSSGSRVALFNIATTVEHVAWDALAYMTHETRRQAAAMVIHDQRVYEKAEAICDRHDRVTGLANPLGISMLQISSQFPVGNLPQGRRAFEIAAYANDANAPSMVTSKLALWIRMARPDTIVCDEKKQEDPLLTASTDAVKLARKLASESSFKCFSEAAGIPEHAWNSKRILARTIVSSNASQSLLKRRSEVSFAPTTAIKSTGKLLSELLSPIVPTIESYLETGEDGFQLLESMQYADYNTVYGLAVKSGKDSLLVEIGDSVETKRPQLRSRQANVQTMLAGSQQASLVARMLTMKGPDLSNDVRWQASLKSFLRSTPNEQRIDSLWQLAQGYRHRGYWNRWRVCLDLLIAEAPRSGAAELASLQQMQFLGSNEVRHFRAQSSVSPSSVEESTRTVVQTAAISSPFAQNIKTASHTSKQTINTISPSEEYQRVQASVPIRFPTLQWDPRYLVTEAAFQRKQLNNQPSNSALLPSPFRRLASSQGLVGWQAVGIQEICASSRMTEDKAHMASVIGKSDILQYSIRRTEGRPKLDGRLDDLAWQGSIAMRLESVWMDDPKSTCDVQMIHDGEFLFIAVKCNGGTQSLSNRSQSLPERLTFRFDTDRDYLTWFELQVDEAGNVTERCMDMQGWQPEWYFKSESGHDGWQLEAAIPIVQLQSEPLLSNPMWAMAIQRSIPNQGIQTNRAMFADRLLLTSPTLVRFCELDDTK